jgi:hypothetical protein
MKIQWASRENRKSSLLRIKKIITFVRKLQHTQIRWQKIVYGMIERRVSKGDINITS